jgi:hypothetical protein
MPERKYRRKCRRGNTGENAGEEIPEAQFSPRSRKVAKYRREINNYHGLSPWRIEH